MTQFRNCASGVQPQHKNFLSSSLHFPLYNRKMNITSNKISLYQYKPNTSPEFEMNYTELLNKVYVLFAQGHMSTVISKRNNRYNSRYWYKFRAFSHDQSIPTSFPLSRWRPTPYWFQVNLLIPHWIMDIFPNPVSQYEGHNSILVLLMQ